MYIPLFFAKAIDVQVCYEFVDLISFIFQSTLLCVTVPCKLERTQLGNNYLSQFVLPCRQILIRDCTGKQLHVHKQFDNVTVSLINLPTAAINCNLSTNNYFRTSMVLFVV